LLNPRSESLRILLTTALETKLTVGLYNRRHEAAP